MDKKRKILLGAAVLALAVVLALLIGIRTSERKPEQVDAQALYDNHVRQINADVLITLEKNDRTDCRWQFETEEDSAFTVTDQSSKRQGRFRISGSEPGSYEGITFRLLNEDTGRCVYEIEMTLHTDPNGAVFVGSNGHMPYSEDVEGGQGTALPFICYSGPDGTLCIDVTPAAGGETPGETHEEKSPWSIETEDMVSALRIASAAENGIAFRFSFFGEGETQIRLCHEKLGAAISLLLERRDDGALCVKEQAVVDYAPPPHDPTQFDAVRAEFAAQYGAWTLPAGAEEQNYDLDTEKKSTGTDEDIPCGIMSFLLNGKKWIYAVSATATLAEISKDGKDACTAPDAVTVGGVKVDIYPLEDSIAAFWAADDCAHCLYGIKSDVETMTAVLQEMLGG